MRPQSNPVATQAGTTLRQTPSRPRNCHIDAMTTASARYASWI